MIYVHPQPRRAGSRGSACPHAFWPEGIITGTVTVDQCGLTKIIKFILLHTHCSTKPFVYHSHLAKPSVSNDGIKCVCLFLFLGLLS